MSYGTCTYISLLTEKCHVANMPGVETLDIFNNGVKLSIGMTVENRENASVKCRPEFDPDIDYEDPYVMTCDHGDWSKELTCTPSKLNFDSFVHLRLIVLTNCINVTGV